MLRGHLGNPLPALAATQFNHDGHLPGGHRLTPEFGYLLDENRCGQLLVKLDVEQMDAAALGYLIGKIAVDRVPVLVHYPFNQTDLKNMGAAMASSGGVTLFHVVGLTPEAPTLDAVFADEPAQTVTITQKDLDALSADARTQANRRSWSSAVRR